MLLYLLCVYVLKILCTMETARTLHMAPEDPFQATVMLLGLVLIAGVYI